MRLGVGLPDLAQHRLTERVSNHSPSACTLRNALPQELRGHLFEHHAARAEMNCLDDQFVLERFDRGALNYRCVTGCGARVTGLTMVVGPNRQAKRGAAV